MSGNATNADDELPKLADDDEGGESTVAMDAPVIPNGAPLPVSQPPPAVSPSPAFPAPAFPKVEPVAARPAVPLPSAKSSVVMPGPRPPPARMPTPGVPLSPRAPLPPSARGPAPPAAGPGRLGGTQPVAPQPVAPTPVRPPEESVTDTGMVAAADPQDVEDDDDDDMNRDDGPTMATAPGAMAGVGDPSMFEIDEPAARAAQAAASRPVDTRRSPLASTGFAHSPLGAPDVSKQPPPKRPLVEEKKEEDEAATVAVPKDVLERVRANPKAVLAEEAARTKQSGGDIPRIGEDEEESTKAVPRESLLRQQDAHVIVGEDAMGDEATLAVAPEYNAASKAIGPPGMGDPRPLGPDDVPAFPAPPLGFSGAGPAPGMPGYGMHRPVNAPPNMGQQMGQMGPMGGMGGQPHAQPNQPWQGHDPQSASMRGMPPSGGMQAHPMGPPGALSSGVMPSALPAGGQFPPQGQQMMSPQQRMGVMPTPQPVNQMGWMQPPQQGGANAASATRVPKISGQVILLVIVGAVCLAIFVTGIVLFATTKF